MKKLCIYSGEYAVSDEDYRRIVKVSRNEHLRIMETVGLIPRPSLWRRIIAKIRGEDTYA